MQKTILFLCLSLLLAQHNLAQEGNDPFRKMKDEFQQDIRDMQEEADSTFLSMQKEFNDYLKQINAEFQEYLSGNFQEYPQETSLRKEDKAPKPVDQPEFDIPKEKQRTVKIEGKIPEPALSPLPVSQPPAVPAVKIPDNRQQYRQSQTIDFFGTAISVYYDKRMKELRLNAVSPDGFAAYWEDFSDTYYHLFNESLQELQNRANLNDWGKYLVIRKTAEALFDNYAHQKAWIWAALNQSGIHAKIGYSGNKPALMLPFIQNIYNVPYYKIKGVNYYLIDKDEIKGDIYTYEQDFVLANQKIDLNVEKNLNFANPDDFVIKNTTLPGETQPIELKIHSSTIDFFSAYPQTEESVYLNAALSAEIKNELFSRHSDRIEGMSETEAVSYLLDYLHHSFAYKIDQEQFDHEKMFFPDEIFYYPYSDCEDRTVLFTTLVKGLLGLDVAAVIYFNHAAAAVAFTEPVDGYSFKIDDVDYTVCDPTYTDAPIGAVMPRYLGYTPLAIKINNENSGNFVWTKIIGDIVGGNENHVFISERKKSENNKYLLSGWFRGRMEINGKSYLSEGTTPDLWFASYNASGEAEWFQHVRCTGKAYTQAFNSGKKGNLYALINYQEEIQANDNTARARDQGFLVFGVSPNSEIVLFKNLDMVRKGDQKLAFYGKYTAAGSELDFVSFPIDAIHFDSEITVDSFNDIVVRGIVGEIEGFVEETPVKLASAAMDAENAIEHYMNAFRNLNYNARVTGLFASLRYLSQDGKSISGTTVQNLLNKHNPSFRRKNPKMYQSLRDLKFVINQGGVIHIEILNGEKVVLNMMSIRNNSNIQIIRASSDSYKIRILDGVKVGKAFVWYDLNSIVLKPDGYLVFDYDTDHSKKEVPMDDIID